MGQSKGDSLEVRVLPPLPPQDEMVAPACKAANVRAFPTWVIGDKSVEGMLQLDEIEREVARAEAAAATVGRVDGSA